MKKNSDFCLPAKYIYPGLAKQTWPTINGKV